MTFPYPAAAAPCTLSAGSCSHAAARSHPTRESAHSLRRCDYLAQTVRQRGTPSHTCMHTGLTVPECSCSACVEQLIKQVSPGLLQESAPATAELRALHPPQASSGPSELDELAA